MHLFLERARAVRPGFNPSDEDERLVAEITRRLEGLPLAIELAAARANVLGLSELLSVVDRRVALLADPSLPDPSRSALERLVEWSYDLLHGDEKTLLHALAVHRGGASLPSLVAVGARHGLDEADRDLPARRAGRQVDRLRLVPGRQLTLRPARHDPRVRARAPDRERRSRPTREAHAEYFAGLADRARTELRGPEWLACKQRLELENDNLWSALDIRSRRARPSSRDPARGARAVLRARRAHLRRAALPRARAGCRAADAGPLELRIELLSLLCYLATEELDRDAAIEAGRAGARARRPARPRGRPVSRS